MHQINFRKWLEAEDKLQDPHGIEDPEYVGDILYKSPAGKNIYNDNAISVFAGMMASPELNAKSVADALNGHFATEVRYGPLPISNNLLTVEDHRLRTAVGRVVSPQEPAIFEFFIAGKNQGCIIIQHPPAMYGLTIGKQEGDAVMMRSIIRHEVGHAGQWINPNLPKMRGTNQLRKWNATLYATNFHEAQQYAEQLRYLIAQVGDVAKVLVIIRNSPLGFAPAMIPVAEAFLRRYVLQNEVFDPNPPAIVVNQQQVAAKQIIKAVTNIFNLLQVNKFIVER